MQCVCTRFHHFVGLDLYLHVLCLLGKAKLGTAKSCLFVMQHCTRWKFSFDFPTKINLLLTRKIKFTLTMFYCFRISRKNKRERPVPCCVSQVSFPVSLFPPESAESPFFICRDQYITFTGTKSAFLFFTIRSY